MSDHRSRNGRPPLDEDDDSVPVHVKMTTRQYDEVYERAQRERVSVPEIIRRSLDQTKKET